MAVGNEYLSTLFINGVMQGLNDVRNLPQDLLFLQRTPIVPALDEEIMVRFLGRVLIADLVADDSQAVVYSTGKFQPYAASAPNLKLGVHMTQAQIQQLLRLMLGGSIRRDEVGVFENYISRTVDALLLGVRQRMEALIIAMHLDGLSYDRLGVKMSGVTWGKPSSLKVVTSTAWEANPTTAVPISDIQTIQLNGRVRYGVNFDRITMSTSAFRAMIATTQYQNLARAFIPPQLTFTNISLLDLNSQQLIAQSVLRATIELYDARYFYQGTEGAISSAPFLPLNDVILGSTSHDGDAQSSDFANGIVTETMVSQMVNSQMIGGGFPAPERGPVAYATGTPDLNPPNITFWGVARGFPRLHNLAHNAVLDVGTITETIPLQGDLF